MKSIEPDPLQKTHNQLLALQNALDVGGVGFWCVYGDDRIECDSKGRSLLGLKPSDRLYDLTDFLLQIKEAQHEDFLDALDAARSKNQEFKRSLHLEKAAADNSTGLQLSARACRLPGELDSCVCGLLQPIQRSSAELEKRSESELAEARSANAELANFASIASHDMREPLRMITSYLRLLQERSPKALDDRARRYINYACEGADRMRGLIEDLLSYARLDQSSNEAKLLALEEPLAHAIENLSASIRDTKAEITVAIDDTPLTMGDSVRLTRLFQNLIANAIKFNRTGEVPRVRVTLKDGDLADACSKWIICIEDQGIGIQPEHYDMLFNLFQRLHTRDEFEGSGIGLAVSKKIAEQHNGRIWFDSEFGKGSTFYVALNKADAQSPI